MNTKKPKPNPHCPVKGCKAAKPHESDPIVKGMLIEFGNPERLTLWAYTAMGELAYSIQRDAQDRKIFAWYTRLRQVEELYVKTLYVLFLSTPAELPHILSGEMPNSFSRLYDTVNTVVFEGRGLLRETQPGLHSGTFTPMETLHTGAHASFKAMLTCIGWILKPELEPDLNKYSQHVDRYYKFLGYMHQAFKAGKQKQDVLEGVKNLHRPASHWAVPKP